MENKTFKTEYSAGSAHPRACYSSLWGYGVAGRSAQTIITPRPAGVTPKIFLRFPPRPVPAHLLQAPPLAETPPDFNASPYKKMSGFRDSNL